MGPAAAKNAPGALGGPQKGRRLSYKAVCHHKRPSAVIKGRRSSKKALKAARAL